MTAAAGVAQARRAARTVKRLPDRLLHPLRRRAALRYLQRRPRPGSVLVVCHGNICRSPYAAALLRTLPECGHRGIRIESAGFAGSGRICPPFTVDVAVTRGFDLSSHRSRGLTPHHVATADLILVMDAAQRRTLRRLFGPVRHVLVLGDLDPLPVDTRGIEDPVEQPREAFERSYARIERCVGALAAALRRTPDA